MVVSVFVNQGVTPLQDLPLLFKQIAEQPLAKEGASLATAGYASRTFSSSFDQLNLS